jgi:hypothetical protein
MNGSNLYLEKALIRACRKQQIGRLLDATLTAGIVVFIVGILLIVGQILGWQKLNPYQTVLTIALTAGVIRWCFSSPVTLAQTAQQLDRLNQTNDLLATAWFVHTSHDVWDQIIVHQAENRAKNLIFPTLLGRYPGRVHLSVWLAVLAVGMTHGLFGSIQQQTSQNDPETRLLTVMPNSSFSHTEISPQPVRTSGRGESLVPEVVEIPRIAASEDSKRPENGSRDATGSGQDPRGTQTEWISAIGNRLSDPSSIESDSIVIGSKTAGRESDSFSGVDSDPKIGAGVSDTVEKTVTSSWKTSTDTMDHLETSASVGFFPDDLPPDRRAVLKRYFDR